MDQFLTNFSQGRRPTGVTPQIQTTHENCTSETTELLGKPERVSTLFLITKMVEICGDIRMEHPTGVGTKL